MENPDRHKRNQALIEKMQSDAQKLASKSRESTPAETPPEKARVELREKSLVVGAEEMAAHIGNKPGMHIEDAEEAKEDMYSGNDPAANWLREHDPEYKKKFDV